MDRYLLILCGLVYAVFFLALAYRRPNLALTLIFATSPMNQDISGGGPLRFSLAEVNLLLAVPIVLFRAKRAKGLLVIVLGGFYLLVGLACSLPQWRDTTLTVFVQCAIYLVVAVGVFASLPRTVEDFRPCLIGYVVLAMVLAATIAITRSPYVLGMHKNNAGSAVAIGFLIALELSFQNGSARAKWFYRVALLVLGAGLLFSLSRGSWLSAIAGATVIFILRGQFGLMLRASLLLAMAAALGWTLLPAESKNYASGLSKEDWNIRMRYEMKDFALSKFESSPVMGVGFGLRKEYDCTNLVFSTLAETGVLGLGALILIFLGVAFLLLSARRGLKRDSLALSVVTIAGAVTVAKLAHGMVDHYWVRGTLMAAWASVGMAAWVASEKSRLLRLRVPQRARVCSSSTPAMLPASCQTPLSS